MEKARLNFISSWDDGRAEDIRLSELLLKYNIPAIFYIPDCGHLTTEDIQKLDSQGFEIGGHTVSHPQDMKSLDDDRLKYEIEGNKEWLEAILNKKITKFCYPRGRYDDRVIEAVKAAGYESARTTRVLSVQQIDPFTEGTTIHVYPRHEYQHEGWRPTAESFVRLCAENNLLFHIWGHSWEIEKFGQWEALEEFFKWLSQNYQLIKK